MSNYVSFNEVNEPFVRPKDEDLIYFQAIPSNCSDGPDEAELVCDNTDPRTRVMLRLEAVWGYDGYIKLWYLIPTASPNETHWQLIEEFKLRDFGGSSHPADVIKLCSDKAFTNLLRWIKTPFTRFYAMFEEAVGFEPSILDQWHEYVNMIIREALKDA